MQKTILERYDSFTSDFSDPGLQLTLRLPEPVQTQIVKRSLTTSHNAIAVADETEKSRIKEVEVDIVCEELYDQMEEQAMLDILCDLEHEMVEQYSAPSSPVSAQPAYASLLWDIVATPTMMHSFGLQQRCLPLPVHVE